MADAVVTNTFAAVNGQKLALVPSTSTTASPPSSPTSGDIWMPSDSYYVQRYSGSAWTPWGPIYPMTPPPTSSWSWVNQGGASVDTTYGGIYLQAPAGAGDNLRMRVRTAPATPYTITTAILASRLGLSYAACGLCWRDSASGKVITVMNGFDTAVSEVGFVNALKWTDATTYSAAYLATPYHNAIGSLIFLRLADTGTTRSCSISTDGQHWIEVHSVGRTDFLTADQVGIVCNSAQATWPVGVTLVSWKET